VVASASLAQVHIIAAANITTAPPQVGDASAAITSNLALDDITSGQPVVRCNQHQSGAWAFWAKYNDGSARCWWRCCGYHYFAGWGVYRYWCADCSQHAYKRQRQTHNPCFGAVK
jgi:hypothetical protein